MLPFFHYNKYKSKNTMKFKEIEIILHLYLYHSEVVHIVFLYNLLTILHILRTKRSIILPLLIKKTSCNDVDDDFEMKKKIIFILLSKSGRLDTSLCNKRKTY